jgi:aminoglycoside phosphotransferase (APT) family kinase protein
VGILERDPEATAGTLTRWLREAAGAAEPVVSDISIPGATGWSNETIFFDATWGAGDERRTRQLVARIAPSGYRVFPEDTFVRQHAVMRALAERTDVPMAAVHQLETDPSWFGQPFWTMDRVDGDIPADAPPYAGSGWLHDATAEQQAQAWHAGIDAMASVHQVDLDDLGLPPGTYPTVDDTLAGWLDEQEAFLTWAEDGQPLEVARQAMVVLRRDRPPEPAEGPCLVWGDARLSNLIYRDFEVAAVLDWEMSGIGDPLLDLGWWLFADHALTTGSGCTRVPGFASRDETARRWTAATDRSADALPWFELFAGLRFTVIMLRMGVLLADVGFVPPGFARDNLISQALAVQLEGGQLDGA